MGSLLFMLGFAILAGPIAHLKHITSKERLPFTAAWLGSLALTLFFAIGVSSLSSNMEDVHTRLTWRNPIVEESIPRDPHLRLYTARSPDQLPVCILPVSHCDRGPKEGCNADAPLCLQRGLHDIAIWRQDGSKRCRKSTTSVTCAQGLDFGSPSCITLYISIFREGYTYAELASVTWLCNRQNHRQT